MQNIDAATVKDRGKYIYERQRLKETEGANLIFVNISNFSNY